MAAGLMPAATYGRYQNFSPGLTPPPYSTLSFPARVKPLTPKLKLSWDTRSTPALKSKLVRSISLDVLKTTPGAVAKAEETVPFGSVRYCVRPMLKCGLTRKPLPASNQTS